MVFEYIQYEEFKIKIPIAKLIMTPIDIITTTSTNKWTPTITNITKVIATNNLTPISIKKKKKQSQH